MRKQYHLRRGESGFDAWDVDRLIELSEGLPVEDVPLSSVCEVDSEYWFQGRQRPTVRAIMEHLRLVQEVDLSWPIILGPDGRVLDGMHRVARALLEGRPSVRAVRLPELPEPDYSGCDPDELPYDR